ncbi:hypothetical protein T492DRAFT_992349 [Pavlovales sp. CCMP2436]|nr:hypothetical protein T492DRAFT_992349 [Pavlovales sp. CCMP2436]
MASMPTAKSWYCARGSAGASSSATAPRSAGRSKSQLEGMMGLATKLKNAGIWLGSDANVTPFHYDLCHGFLVQVLGTKTFTFVEPPQWRCMYPRDLSPELSQIDFEARKQPRANDPDTRNSGAPSFAASIWSRGTCSTPHPLAGRPF